MNTAAAIETGSVIVALAIIALVGILMSLAIIREKVDGALKLWGGLGTLIGLVVGTMGTYFFTKDAAQDKIAGANAQKEAVVERAKDLETALAAAEESKAELVNKLEARGPGSLYDFTSWNARRPASGLPGFTYGDGLLVPDDKPEPDAADPPENDDKGN